MSAKTGRTQQLAVRVELDVADRIDALAAKLSRPGLSLGRSDVVRMALFSGLPVLEKSDAAIKQ